MHNNPITVPIINKYSFFSFVKLIVFFKTFTVQNISYCGCLCCSIPGSLRVTVVDVVKYCVILQGVCKLVLQIWSKPSDESRT